MAGCYRHHTVPEASFGLPPPQRRARVTPSIAKRAPIHGCLYLRAGFLRAGPRSITSRLLPEPLRAVWCSRGEPQSVEGRPLDDAEWVERAQRGEVDAYEELVRRYQGIAHRTAYLITRDAAEAEDAAQAGFINAYYALGRFRSDAPFRPWLLKIVANEARNRRRSATRRSGLELRLAEDRPRDDAAPSPEAAVLAREPRERLLQAVNRLAENDRVVIGLRYFLDLSEAEMAKVLGCAPGTVKSRLSRALGRLREVMGAEATMEAGSGR